MWTAPSTLLFLRFADPEHPSVQFLPIEPVDGFLRLGLGQEFHKSEPSRLSGVPISGNVHIHYLARPGQQFGELFFCSMKAEIADKYFRRNGSSPFPGGALPALRPYSQRPSR
jgi:hypothetical protein